MTSGFLSGSRNSCKLLWVFLLSFGFTRRRLDPLCGQVLHHDCISAIVSRFAIVTENFVIRSYQVTNSFRFGHDCTSTSSARGPRYFRPQTDILILVFREVSLPLLLAAPKVIHENWKCLDVHATGFPVTLQEQFQFLLVLAQGFPVTLHSYSHLFLLLDFPCWSQYPVMKMLTKQVKE